MNNVGGAFDLKYVQLFRKGLVVSHDSRDVFGLVPPFAVVAQAASFRRSRLLSRADVLFYWDMAVLASIPHRTAQP